MAIIDKLTEFCDATTMDQETGTFLMGNQIDLGAASRNVGDGHPVYLVFRFTATPTDGGDSATATFKLVSDDSASIATNGTASEHLVTQAFLKTEMTAGTTFVYTLPNDLTYERYLGILMVVATAGFDSGSFDAWLSRDPPTTWKAYADAAN